MPFIFEVLFEKEKNMLNEKIEKALNNHIIKEADASNSYLAMASWCEVFGLKESTEFYYEQSIEEREHMLKLIRYVNENDGTARIPAINEPKNDFVSIAEIVDFSLEQEMSVTRSIHEIVALCDQENDYATKNFIQWFVQEQQEEENLFRSLKDMIRMIGIEGVSLIMLDNEIAKLRNKSETQI